MPVLPQHQHQHQQQQQQPLLLQYQHQQQQLLKQQQMQQQQRLESANANAALSQGAATAGVSSASSIVAGGIGTVLKGCASAIPAVWDWKEYATKAGRKVYLCLRR